MTLLTSTIGELTLAESILNTDLIEVEIAASGLSRKVPRSMLIGATLLGDGTIATGGFALTVPATGTAALRNVVQTFTQLQTFGAGISFGNETLSTFRNEQTWTGSISGDTAVTATFTTNNCKYWRFNDLVFYKIELLINTISGGSGQARIGLPITAVASRYLAPAGLSGPNTPDTPVTLTFEPVISQSYGLLLTTMDNASRQGVNCSDLSNGDSIFACGFYEV